MCCLSNDQELVQSEPKSHPVNRGGKKKKKKKKNKLTITY